MVLIRQISRFIAIFFLLAGYALTSLTVGALSRDHWRRVRRRAYVISFYSRLFLRVLNIRVRSEGGPDFRAENFLIVSNHLSYLDVLVMASVVPTSFVTSTEIRDTPFLGHLTDLGGCLYVERRSRKNILNEVGELAEGLRRGLHITVFPEATSTNGDGVLRFRRPLYNASIKSQCATLPACINYRTISGEPLNQKNRDIVFWYGDMSFLPHLWAVAGTSSIEVDIQFLTPVRTTAESEDRHLAEESYRQVCDAYTPCPVG